LASNNFKTDIDEQDDFTLYCGDVSICLLSHGAVTVGFVGCGHG
jgi:hypothetical protein